MFFQLNNYPIEWPLNYSLTKSQVKQFTDWLTNLETKSSTDQLTVWLTFYVKKKTTQLQEQ